MNEVDNTKGYVLIDRQRHKDLAVIYPSVELARKAITDHLLIDGFCEEDALDAYVPEKVTKEDLSDREVVIVDWSG